MKYDVIIIGAGAAGVLAGKELVSSGLSVCILEANNSIGGRISTVKEKFEMPVELGAEFVHGKLQLTRKLLKDAGLSSHKTKGKWLGFREGRWRFKEEHEPHWDEFMKKSRQQKKDCSIDDFLDQYFYEKKYEALRAAVKRFAEGFNLADTSLASLIAIRKDWEHVEEDQFRVEGGYGMLLNFIFQRFKKLKGKILFNTVTRKIEYERGKVSIKSANGKKYEASRLIVTASAGVMQSRDIQFSPAPLTHLNAIDQLGFGAIIKFVLQFKSAFWREKDREIGFMLTDLPVPTWWTQFPVENNILSGWLGGPEAKKYSTHSDNQLLELALRSLGRMFNCSPTALQQRLLHYEICNWQKNPFCRGGYSYSTLYSEKAIELINEPILDTIYFAGEAYYVGESQGTVEAAFQSGHAAAGKLRASLAHERSASRIIN